MLGVGRNKQNEKDQIIWQVKFDQSTADVLDYEVGQRHGWLTIPRGSLLPKCLSHSWVKFRAIQWTTLEIHVCHDSVFTECQKLLGTRQIHLVQYFFSGQSRFREAFISDSTQKSSLFVGHLLSLQANRFVYFFSPCCYTYYQELNSQKNRLCV